MNFFFSIKYIVKILIELIRDSIKYKIPNNKLRKIDLRELSLKDNCLLEVFKKLDILQLRIVYTIYLNSLKKKF